MRALISHYPGAPDSLVLEQVDCPVPAEGEILIRVVACSANYPDVLMVQGRYQFQPPRPFAPGAEVAGIVETVGEGVNSFAPGDRVMAVCSWGGMAEMVVAQANKCVAVPDFLPLDEAAALQLTYGTAHNALCGSGQLEAGQTLLVLGAAGGVGMAGVEVGKALGATVIAAVSSPEKAEAVRSRGADHVITYAPGELSRDERRSLAARFRDTDAGRPHVVLDPVGGSYSEAALRAIRRGGRMVVVGFAAGTPEVPLNLVLFNEAIICAGAWGAVVANQPERYRRTISELLELYRKKLIRPLITARLPLERGAEALSMLERRSAIGKVVVLIGSEQV